MKAVLALVALCGALHGAVARDGTASNPYKVVTMNSEPFSFNSTGEWQGAFQAARFSRAARAARRGPRRRSPSRRRSLTRLQASLSR